MPDNGRVNIAPGKLVVYNRKISSGAGAAIQHLTAGVVVAHRRFFNIAYFKDARLLHNQRFHDLSFRFGTLQPRVAAQTFTDNCIDLLLQIFVDVGFVDNLIWNFVLLFHLLTCSDFCRDFDALFGNRIRVLKNSRRHCT